MASPTKVSEGRRGAKRAKRTVKRNRRANRLVLKSNSTVNILRELEKSL